MSTTTPFVAQLRARPETLRLGTPGAPVITVRVQVPEVWDTVRVDASPDTPVVTVKEGALVTLLPKADQAEYVVALRPDAEARTVVLGEFSRLLAQVDLSVLPPAAPTPEDVYVRGVALVEAVDAARGGAEPLPSDDLDDPWGRGDQTFTRIGDEIEHTVEPLAEALLP